MRPRIFISAVSKELKSARQLVSHTLQFMGYEPVWQDIFGTEQGDLRAMLREKIDGCSGVFQLVGKYYGAEPPTPDEQFGRSSYTQYEALYAKQRGKKVWYIFLDDFSPDSTITEPEELTAIQTIYRNRLQSESHLYHAVTTREALEASVLKLRDDLSHLRRGVKQWAAAVAVLLVVLVGAVIWLTTGQGQTNKNLAEMKEEMAKLRQGVSQFAEVQARVRQERPLQNAAKGEQSEVQQHTYEELAKGLGLDPAVLEKKLPQLAQELKTASNTSTYERANASYVAANYSEAERLALKAADEAQQPTPPKTTDAIKAYELAGNSAIARVEYADAIEHFRSGAQLIDRANDHLGWARQQQNIAFVLIEQGSYVKAEETYRAALDEYARAHRGEEDKDVLALRNGLAIALRFQGKYAEAEAEDRRVIAIEEKVLGPENRETLMSRMHLGTTLVYQGKYAEAEREYRAVAKLEAKVFGPEHPETLRCRLGVANALWYQAKYADAEIEYSEVVRLEEKVLGPEHPKTLIARHNLADAHLSQNKNVEAEAEFRTVIKLRDKVLGPEHPDTLNSRMDLGTALRNQGKYAEAENEYRTVVRLEEKVLGPTHPETLRTCYNLALCLKAENKFDEARMFAERAAEDGSKILAANHPDVLKYEKLWKELLATNPPRQL